MKNLLLLLLVAAASLGVGYGQSTRSGGEAADADINVNSQYTVESVEVKGLNRSQYPDALYEEMQQLVGQRLNNEQVDKLCARLAETMHGQYMISKKIERGSQPEHVKVLIEAQRTPWLYRATIGRFVKADVNFSSGEIQIGGDSSRAKEETKVVETVNLKGIPQASISSALFGELQAMAGKRTDRLEANHLLEKLKAELKEDYAVALKITDGATPQESRIVYAVDRKPWLPYRNPRGFITYHQKQGFSLLCCDEDFIGDHTTLTAGWDGDTLIERYKGIGFGVEGRSLGTRHLGARVGFDSFGAQWKPQTRRAVTPASGLELYRTRVSVTPSLGFAFNRNVFVTGGANFTQLRIEGPVERWQAVHEGVASLRFQSNKVKRGKTRLESNGGYEVRTGARSVGSDLVFTRHFADADASVGYGKNTLQLSLEGGKATGSAPLFERFSLGNTTTLRGWNKYDIAPVGGSRMWHATLDYHYGPLGIFLDQGKVWDPGNTQPIRRSLGLMLGHAVGVAFPLQCSRQCGAMFFVRLQ